MKLLVDLSTLLEPGSSPAGVVAGKQFNSVSCKARSRSYHGLQDAILIGVLCEGTNTLLLEERPGVFNTFLIKFFKHLQIRGRSIEPITMSVFVRTSQGNGVVHVRSTRQCILTFVVIPPDETLWGRDLDHS